MVVEVGFSEHRTLEESPLTNTNPTGEETRRSMTDWAAEWYSRESLEGAIRSGRGQGSAEQDVGGY